MSDTAAPKSGCARTLIKLGLVLLLLAVGAGYVAYGKAFQPEPLDFAPFRFGALEQPALMAKFELQGNLKSLLTGDESAEVSLSQRQFNGLLFGEAEHTQHDKARFLVEGDTLRFESSRQRPDTEPPSYANIQALVRIDVTPDATQVEVLEGTFGELPIGGPLSGFVGQQIAAWIQMRRQDEPRLKRLKALWVEDGQVYLVYTPPE